MFELDAVGLLAGHRRSAVHVDGRSSVRNDQDKLQYEDSIHFMDKEIHIRVEALPTIDQSPFEQHLPDIIFFVSSIMILGFFVAVMSYGMDEKE